jgi:hypothetical protein
MSIPKGRGVLGHETVMYSSRQEAAPSLRLRIVSDSRAIKEAERKFQGAAINVDLAWPAHSCGGGEKKGGTMTCRSNELFSILLFASSIFFLNPPAQAQACTPIVYLFRHAEDEARRVELTNAGKHAALYPEMLLQYQSIFSDCPIKRVLAMYDINSNGTPGTTNLRENYLITGWRCT